MADHNPEIDFIPVKAEDIVGDRRALYGAFVNGIALAIGVTAVVLGGIYLIWG